MTNEEARSLILDFAGRQDHGRFPCPRCGRMAMDANPARNALSRRVDCYICDHCGNVEAIEDLIQKRLPLNEWMIAVYPTVWGME